MDAIVSDEIDFRNVGNNDDGEVVCVSGDCDMRDFDDDLYCGIAVLEIDRYRQTLNVFIFIK